MFIVQAHNLHFFRGLFRTLTAQLSVEQLQARMIKNQAEQLELMKQQQRLAGADDFMGEDPEMVDMKMYVISLHAEEG